MIDIRYHIASLVAVFLALAVGILIGSTVVGSDVLLDQQKKIITRLENEFAKMRQQMDALSSENKFIAQIAKNYEQYSQAVSPPIIRNRLANMKLALIVTGGQEIPAGLLNSLSLAGARVTSTTVMLPGIDLSNEQLKIGLCDLYQVSHDTPVDELRKMIAHSLVSMVVYGDSEEVRDYLRKNNLTSFNGQYGIPLDAVIIIGGTNDLRFYHPASLDEGIIGYLLKTKVKTFGCETSRVQYSYMVNYQKYDISTVDDIDLTPGQVALIRAIEGEAGDYGVKDTAAKFMPSLPTEYMGGGVQ